MSNSCLGCKYLYTYGTGYSNYTWEGNVTSCALNKNEDLKNYDHEDPWDWNRDPDDDNWPRTANGRCESFTAGEMIELDVDNEEGPGDLTDDEELINLICEQTGRERYGWLSRKK